MNRTETNAEHDKAFEMLPWWCNGSLSPDEHAQVGSHVDQCPVCQQEAKLLTQSFETVMQMPTTSADARSSFAQTMKRIEAEEASGATKGATNSVSLPERLFYQIKGYLWPADGLWGGRFAVAAMGVVIASVALLVLQQPTSPVDADYSVLSSSGVVSEAASLSLVFAKETSTAQAEQVVRELSSSHSITTELQHSDDMHYVLLLPEDTSVQQLGELMRGLQQHPAISSVDMQVPE